MPPLTQEIQTPESLVIIAEEFEALSAELRRLSGLLEVLEVTRFIGERESARRIGTANFRTLVDDLRIKVRDMRMLDAQGTLSELSDTDSKGKIYRQKREPNSTKNKPADKGKRAAKPKHKRT